MTITTEAATTTTGPTDPGYGPCSKLEFLAAGARVFITLYDEITLDCLLVSPDPGLREMGEALVATGEASFVPTAEYRAMMRAAITS
jgi:hypothetical protein